jgi:dTMP kinase
MPGLFVSLDGLDGTGKSTQCRLLAEWLTSHGHGVVQCRDPGGTLLGDQLRKIVLDNRQTMTRQCEAFLFMASRAELVAQIIRPAMKDSKVVVCDRFLLANVVYQGHAGGLSDNDLWRLGTIATEGLLPDLTIVLDLPVDAAIQRRGREPDRMEARGIAYQQKVRDGFLLEAAAKPDQIQVVDATAEVEVVHKRICELVAQCLNRR